VPLPDPTGRETCGLRGHRQDPSLTPLSITARTARTMPTYPVQRQRIAAQPDPYLAPVRHGQAKHEVARRDQHPRRAIPALQGMLAVKAGAKLNGDFIIIQPLDRGYARSVAGDGVSDAGARRHVVEQQRACPAHAVLAAEMGAGQIETVAQKISKMVRGSTEALTARAFTVRAIMVTWRPQRWHGAAPRHEMCRSAASAMPAFIRIASATRASNCRAKSPVTCPPKSGRPHRQQQSELFPRRR